MLLCITLRSEEANIKERLVQGRYSTFVYRLGSALSRGRGSRWQQKGRRGDNDGRIQEEKI